MLFKIIRPINTLLKYIFRKVFDKNLILFIIFLSAFFLRILGTNPGYLNHPDEPKIADAALNITFHLDFKPIAFYYGSLLPIVYALFNFLFILPIYFLIYVPINILSSFPKDHLGILDCFFKSGILYCTQSQSKEFFTYLTRYETAFLSSLSVILIYFLGKRLFNKQVGLIAASFTAINYRHVLSSHFSLADAPLIVFIILSILLSLKISEKQSLKNYLWAGFGLGFVFSIKYFVYTIPVLLLSHILGCWKNSSILQNINRIIFNHKIYISIVLALLTFFVINPYLLLDTQNAKEQFELNAMFYKTRDLSWGNFLSPERIPIFSLYYLFKYGLGELVSVATILGFFLSLIKYPRPTFILSSVIFPFFYFFLVISGTTFIRNYASILPLLTFFPAIFLLETMNRIPHIVWSKGKLSHVKPILLVLGVFILGIDTLKHTAITSYTFAQQNNYKLLENWVLEELPDNSNVVKSWGTPFPGRKQVNLTDWDLYSTSYQSLSELNNMKVDWLILSSESGIYINHFLNLSESQWALKNAFLNENIVWNFLEDNYASLLTRELGNYRVKEFIKPFESLDPSFVAIKIPSLQPAQIKEPVANFILKPELSSPCFSTDQSKLSIRANPQKFLKGLQVTKLSLGVTPARENTLYKLSAKVINNKIDTVSSYRSKFIRLDFYSSSTLLGTSVSNQIKEQNKWVELTAFGPVPKGTTNIKAVFQIDECSKVEETYQLINIVFQQSDALGFFDSNQYPYFNKPLPNNFIWLPPL